MCRSRVALGALVLAVFFTACSAETADVEVGDPSPTSAVSNPAAPAALQFSAPAVGGGTIDFTQYAGQTVALWFWAPT